MYIDSYLTIVINKILHESHRAGIKAKIINVYSFIALLTYLSFSLFLSPSLSLSLSLSYTAQLPSFISIILFNLMCRANLYRYLLWTRYHMRWFQGTEITRTINDDWYWWWTELGGNCDIWKYNEKSIQRVSSYTKICKYKLYKLKGKRITPAQLRTMEEGGGGTLVAEPR